MNKSKEMSLLKEVTTLRYFLDLRVIMQYIGFYTASSPKLPLQVAGPMPTL